MAILVSSPELSTSFQFLPHLPRPSDARISIKLPSSWVHLGALLDPAPDRLPAHLRKWLDLCVDGDVTNILTEFLAVANDFLQSHGLSHYCLTIRATQPTTDYDVARWHTDTIFFEQGQGQATTQTTPESAAGWINILGRRPSVAETSTVTDWKLCTTLTGPSTLFIPEQHQSAARQIQHETKQACAADHVCTSIRCLGCATSAESVRERLVEQFASLGYVQAHTGQCTVFRVGHDHGAVHSEPPMSPCDRIFVNIVPGTEEEIRRLAWQWGMEYPRNWTYPTSIGLGKVDR